MPRVAAASTRWRSAGVRRVLIGGSSVGLISWGMDDSSALTQTGVAQRRAEAAGDSLPGVVIRASSVLVVSESTIFRVDVVGRMVAGTRVLEESPGSTGRAAR